MIKKSSGIPSHYYNETVDYVKYHRGQPLQLLDPKLPFMLTKFELMNDSGQADYPHRHDFYEILYITEGEGTHVIDFEAYPIFPYSFYFLSKNQVHFWQLKTPLKGYALLFPEEFLGFPSSNIVRAHDFSFFHNVGHAPCLSVDQVQSKMIDGLLEGMEQEFNNDMESSLSVLRAYLHILLTQLNRLYTLDHASEGAETGSSLVRQFEQLVAAHFISDHAVQDYARRIGISTSHLTDTVKAVTGRAPGHIIRDKLILEAKRLLAHSNITAAEIGYRLHFDDSSYFGRFFKRETGMSPTAFRQYILEQYQVSPK
ncbi:MAG: AraC family transcriptional regulator [Psychromonas sp.]